MTMAILAIFFTGLEAQKNSKKDEAYKEMINLVESGSYLFTVHSVQASGGGTVQTNSDYSMEVNDSTFKAYLPYFGRTYQPSYGGDGGIEFDAAPENLELSLKEKKHMIFVSCEVKGKQDKYSLYLSIGSSGYATLNINSQKRQSISYSGKIGPLNKEE